jgi:hypothetical protein
MGHCDICRYHEQDLRQIIRFWQENKRKLKELIEDEDEQTIK